MTRGDLVTVALQGDHGNPRPALVIQSGQFPETAMVTVLLVTSKLVDAPLLRRTVEPSPENGLSKTSQVMIDKAMTVRTDKLGSAFGDLDQAAMLRVNRSLALLLGLAEWCGPGGRLTVLLPAGSTVSMLPARSSRVMARTFCAAAKTARAGLAFLGNSAAAIEPPEGHSAGGMTRPELGLGREFRARAG